MMFVCVYVCMYDVCVCVCMYDVRVCVCMYDVRVCVCMYDVRVCVCLYVTNLYMPVLTHTRIPILAYIHVQSERLQQRLSDYEAKLSQLGRERRVAEDKIVCLEIQVQALEAKVRTSMSMYVCMYVCVYVRGHMP